ncbi:kinase-like domain-containing protein [Chytriomyces cf. hyalinus JEL632]|nr:kinase-like domain-containing protein [Chytriomyces cf. hyalinus JEL632]
MHSELNKHAHDAKNAGIGLARRFLPRRLWAKSPSNQPPTAARNQAVEAIEVTIEEELFNLEDLRDLIEFRKQGNWATSSRGNGFSNATLVADDSDHFEDGGLLLSLEMDHKSESDDAVCDSPCSAHLSSSVETVGPSSDARFLTQKAPRPISSFDEDGLLPLATQPQLLLGTSNRLMLPHAAPIIESFKVYDKMNSAEASASCPFQVPHIQAKINQHYILQDIGFGAFGKVSLSIHQASARYYACKAISKSKIRRKYRWDTLQSTPHSCPGSFTKVGFSCIDRVTCEVEVLKRLPRHPNINALFEVLNDENEDNVYLFFELCELGPVMRIVVNQVVRPFSEEIARTYFRDVLSGMEFLHKNRIIHRDLKPENLLLTIEHRIQIADFGISHVFSRSEDDRLLDKNTSPLFCPPEACDENDTATTLIRGFPFDIWGMGVTLYCFVHGHCPFEDECLPALYYKICHAVPIISKSLSKELQQLLKQILNKSPCMRPLTQELGRHAWVLDSEMVPSQVETGDTLRNDLRDVELESEKRNVRDFLFQGLFL